MSTKAHELKIGLFMFAAVGILVVGLFVFGARSYFEDKVVFETYVDGDVEGLSVGSPVKFRGVAIGDVSRIGFTWSQYGHPNNNFVLVEFKVAYRILPVAATNTALNLVRMEVKKGLRARIKSQGITGASFVSLEYLDPERSPVFRPSWTPNNYYIPSAPSQFSLMLASIQRSLRSLEQLDFGQLGKDASKLLGSLENLAGDLQKANIERIGTEANALLSEVRDTNHKLQGLLEQMGGAIRGTELGLVSTNANTLLIGLHDTNGRLQSLLDRLNSLDVTPLNETLRNARQATDNLNDVLQSLKQYPSGVIFGEAPGPARSLTPQKR